MLELSDADFVSLEGHPVRGRFAEFTYGYVSPHVEQRVKPLTAIVAADVSREALARHPRDAMRDPSAVELDTGCDPSIVESWLQELPIPPSTLVVVSWDAGSAVLTDWALFVHQWDDFCRPSADDTTVWSLGRDWTLCYWHYGLLRFMSRPRAV